MGNKSLAGLKHFRSFRFSFADEDKVKSLLSVGKDKSSLHGEYKLLNLSLSGFAFISDQILNPEKPISLKLILQKKEYLFTGRIVRVVRDRESRNHFIYGVRLTEQMDVDEVEFVEKLVGHFKHKRLRKELTSLLVNEIKLDDPRPEDLLSVLIGLYSDLSPFDERGDFLETFMLQTQKLFRCEDVRFFEVSKSAKYVQSIYPFQIEGLRKIDVEKTVFQKIIRMKKPLVFTEGHSYHEGDHNPSKDNQRNAILVPILNQEQDCVGVIELLNFKRTLTKERLLKYLHSAKFVGVILSTLYENFAFIKHEKSHGENFRNYGQVERDERKLLLIGESDSSRSMRAFIQKYKDTNGPILISGNLGTGKELLARIIHQEGHRRNMPLGVVDIAEWKEDICIKDFFLGSESKVGKFELYSGGTLVLKNIDLLTKKLQEKFIEIFDTRYSIRLVLTSRKSDQILKNDLIADMRALLTWNDEGQIHLPDLKERENDLSLLISFFLSMECWANGFIEKRLSPEVEKAFLSYDWPGNVRELELALKRCVWAYQGSHVISELPETVAPLFDKHQGQYRSFREVLEEFPRPLTQKEQEYVIGLYKAKLANKLLRDYGGDAQEARKHLNLTTQEWLDWVGEKAPTKVA